MAADTIRLPIAGPVNRKVLYAAGAAAVGFVGYAWWTRKPSEAIPEEVVTEGELDAIGDERVPTTGVPYDPNIGAPDTGITTNAQWTQFATDRLNTLGYDPIAVGDALGKFLDRKPLTPAEANIARAAVAQAGEPPVGRPWPVLEVQPPASVGLTNPNVSRIGTAYRNGAWEFQLTWPAVPGAVKYYWQHGITNPTSGYITATTTSVIRAKPSATDTWKIAAVNAAGVQGPATTIAIPFGPPPATPPAPAPSGAKPGAIPTPVGLITTKPNAFGIAYTAAPRATSYRYRWIIDGRGGPWAETKSVRFGVTWKVVRGRTVQAEVVPKNRYGLGPAKRSNIVRSL